MPASARQMGNVWTFPDPRGGNDLPGTWGRHDVPILGYDDKYLIVVSCQNVIAMTIDFFNRYCRQLFITLSPDWLVNGDHTPTKTPLDVDDLSNAMTLINKHYAITA
jgi:hypothetical protein